ncbi:MAG: phosphatase PAP2 family protein [Candidatus Sungbacteria bacterium]|uniref:Phosphatase PAP2 family protein n=1 Tax=Candidatus Sungiibacteriota bacterium TaxID=2750080 RepID=A0A932R1Z2_9BACT|nr:phosphatase PAP2 family protein [Candidatus Sungbacteria bacterium]
MNADLNLFFFLNNLAGRSRVFDVLVVGMATYAPYLLVMLFFLLICFSAYEARQKLRMVWVVAISALVARLGAAEGIRLFYHRPRPFMAYQVRQLLSDNEWSFPSGHATFFFAMATAVYLYNKKWGAGFFAAALLVSAGRVIAGIHYPSDILGGALIGAAVACFVFYAAEKRKTGEIGKRL